MPNMKKITPSKEVDTDELVKRFQQGEISAFDELVERYQSRIYNITYRYTRNPEDALDLVQEVFIKAFKALGKFQRRSAFYSWLYRVAVNVCVDFLRRKSRQHQPVSLDEVINAEVILLQKRREFLPDDAVVRTELRRKISESVLQLPPRQQTVFMLRHRDGLQLKEIAAAIGRSEGTVKAHLFHANRRMREMLTPYLRDE